VSKTQTSTLASPVSSGSMVLLPPLSVFIPIDYVWHPKLVMTAEILKTQRRVTELGRFHIRALRNNYTYVVHQQMHTDKLSLLEFTCMFLSLLRPSSRWITRILVQYTTAL